MKRLAAAILASLLIPLPGHAITMGEAVAQALENNHRARDFRQRTEAQQRRVDSGKAPFWPEVGADYTYQRRENVFSFFQTQDSSTFTAEIRYNLFRGFSDLNTLRSARSTLDAARYEQKAVEADIALEVKRAYIEVLRTRRNREVAKESVELLERQRHDAELFYRGGLTAKNEYLKVDVELASARQELLTAESALRIARKSLGRVTGIPVGEDEAIEEVFFPDHVELDEEALARRMLTQRSEIRFLEARRLARERARDSIRGGYLPSVDLSVSHSRYGETFAFEGL
ncbi:MAG: TolC family protein, partial [Candidatus Deferrimicrobiaceae bacterium]